MKYIISLIVLLLMQSCIPSSAYLVNEYTKFPKGLKFKQFETEVANRNRVLNSNQDSLVPFSILGKKKKLYFEEISKGKSFSYQEEIENYIFLLQTFINLIYISSEVELSDNDEIIKILNKTYKVKGF